MATDSSKALKSFQDDFLTAAIKANPNDLMNDLIRATNVVAVYSQMLQVIFMIAEPVVAAWKLKMFHSRADALLLRSIALVVNNSNKEQRPLTDVDLLEACFNRAAQRCPSAFDHMSAPDWEQSRQIRDQPAASGRAEPLEPSMSGVSEPAPSPELPREPLNGHEPKPSTSKLMEQARNEYGVEELRATLEDASRLVSFRDLDRATQIAIDTITKAIADGQPNAIERHCGSTLLTGYLVGRAMLKTEGGALHFSNPLTEAANAEALIHIATTPAGAPYADTLGSTGLLFVKFQKEMASRAGQLSALGKQARDSLTGASAAAGMVLAVAEHDLYVAD